MDIEEQLEAFEQAWAGECVPEIEDYYSRSMYNPAERKGNDVSLVSESIEHEDLLCELIKVDLHRRWEAALEANARLSSSGSSRRAQQPPLLEEYLARFPQLRLQRTFQSELLLEELIARFEFHDRLPDSSVKNVDVIPSPRPSLSELTSRFPEADENELRSILKEAETYHREHRDNEPGLAAKDGIVSADGAVALFAGRFQFRELLGQGNMGRVYLAFDPRLQRDVAVKIPLFDFGSDQVTRERFLREGRAAAGIRHPNVVAVYEFNDDIRECYIVSEFVDGPTLKQWLKRDERISVSLAARLALLLAQGIHTAHENGVIHRDLKPANILLEVLPVDSSDDLSNASTSPGTVLESGQRIRPRIADFGLACFSEAASELTTSGTMIGTAAYMSPEQIDATPVGPQTDVFALGVILHEMLIGESLFGRETYANTIVQVQNLEPPPLFKQRTDVPRDLSAICECALQKDLATRYVSAQELVEDLSRFLAGTPVRARRIGVAGRTLRWTKRNPLPTCLAVILAGLLAWLSVQLRTVSTQANELTAALVEVREERASAQSARSDAETARENAAAARNIAEFQRQTARKSSYQSDTRLAYQLMNEGRWDQVRDLLNKQLPGESTDLRGIEWTVLQAELDAKWRVIGNHDGAATDCVLNSQNLAFTCGVDGYVRRWNLTTGEPLSPLESGFAELHAMALSPDGKVLAVGGKSSMLSAKVTLLDANTGEKESTLQSHSTTIESISFSPDGRWLAAGSRYQPVQLTRLSDGETFKLPADRRNRTVSFSPDSAWLAVAATHEHSQLWPVDGDAPGEPIDTVAARGKYPHLVRFAPKRPILATSFEYHNIVEFHRQPDNMHFGAGFEEDSSHSLSAQLLSLTVSPNEKKIAAGDSTGRIVSWYLPSNLTGRRFPAGRSFNPHRAAVTDLEFVDDSRVVSVGDDGRLCSSDPLAHSGTAVRWPGLLVHDVVETAGRIFLACGDGTVRTVNVQALWDKHQPAPQCLTAEHQRGAPPLEVARQTSAVRCIDQLPSGDVLAIGTQDGAVFLLDVETYGVVESFDTSQPESSDKRIGAIQAIGFSKDGRYLAFSSETGFLSVVQLSDGRRVVNHFSDRVTPFEFIRNNQQIVACAGKEALVGLDIKNGNVVKEFPAHRVNKLSLNHDETLLACGQADGLVQLISLDEPKSKFVNTHASVIKSVLFDPAGQSIISLDHHCLLRFTSVDAGAAYGEVPLSNVRKFYDKGHLLITDSWLIAIYEIENDLGAGKSSTECRIWNRFQRSK